MIFFHVSTHIDVNIRFVKIGETNIIDSGLSSNNYQAYDRKY